MGINSDIKIDIRTHEETPDPDTETSRSERQRAFYMCAAARSLPAVAGRALGVVSECERTYAQQRQERAMYRLRALGADIGTLEAMVDLVAAGVTASQMRSIAKLFAMGGLNVHPR